jgi:histidinol phosphatase-like PHP family hydrolase
MIDLHTHSILSDGELLPTELLRRALVLGYKAVAITDHVDFGNIELVLNQVIKVAEKINKLNQIKLLPGVELTHIPPTLIPELAKKAKENGAKIIVVHGESPVEPVAEGTNLSALESDIDILAHPGLITEKEVKLAVKRKIYLEISGRKGHCLGNGRLVSWARQYKAKLVINSDAHSSSDLFTQERIRKVGLGAGLTEKELEKVFENSLKIVRGKLK